MVEHKGGVTAEWLGSDRFEVATPGGPRAATLSAAPLYDPGRRRILTGS